MPRLPSTKRKRVIPLTTEPNSKQRRHSKLDELPPEVLHEVQTLIIDGKATYQDIVEHLKTLGHGVSRSCVARYGQFLMQRRHQLHATVEAAKELIKLTDGVSLEELASALALDKVVEVLMRYDKVEMGEFDELNLEQLTGIMRAVSSMQGASIARQKWEAELAERARKAADDVAKTAQRGGLSDEAVQIIRARILGIAEREVPA